MIDQCIDQVLKPWSSVTLDSVTLQTFYMHKVMQYITQYGTEETPKSTIGLLQEQGMDNKTTNVSCNRIILAFINQ